MKTVIIIGTGCAGLSAAIYTARAKLNPIVIEGINPGGQLISTSYIENYPGFSKKIEGIDLINNMKKQSIKFGAHFINDEIIKIKFDKNIKILFGKKNKYKCSGIIIATGASPKLLNIPGEKELWGKGVTNCAICDGAFYQNMKTSVIGGGDSACEEALFLTKFSNQIILIHRRNLLKASKIMSSRVFSHSKIKILWNYKIKEILDIQKNQVDKIKIEHIYSKNIKEIECKGVFINIGHTPNTKIFKNIISLDQKGYLITDKHNQVKTNIPGVFAAGDCVDFKYKQAITAAGMGSKAAIELEKWMNYHKNNL